MMGWYMSSGSSNRYPSPLKSISSPITVINHTNASQLLNSRKNILLLKSGSFEEVSELIRYPEDLIHEPEEFSAKAL